MTCHSGEKCSGSLCALPTRDIAACVLLDTFAKRLNSRGGNIVHNTPFIRSLSLARIDLPIIVVIFCDNVKTKHLN